MAFCKHCGGEIHDGVVLCPHCKKRLPGDGRSSSMPVLIAVAAGCGCLGLVAFLGIFSAILIPNFVDALQKAKQKRTMADMRAVGTALMSWLTDEVDAGSTTSSLPESPTSDDLKRALVPEYLPDVPPGDGWRHPLDYWINPDLRSSQVLMIRSPGRDGIFEAGALDPGPFLATDYDRDIVWADGYFLRYPASTAGRQDSTEPASERSR